ncbi:MAG: hypothetical protein J0I34_24245 [Pseudonocardia sp.]|uniref:hypothetical protein n=1 Tax=unclassified Pseudonocardia TaxID=2619320 RepID=UPI001AD4AF1C|nr:MULTISPECIES: hypothetical protein [unclassified Pseudonocardia]MBN9111881.1 hypothetical protein [Pseudonocardia sp.]
MIDLGDRERPVWRDGRAVLLLGHTPDGSRADLRYLVHVYRDRATTKAQVD